MMVAIIFEFEWVYYLTTLPVDKVIQRRRLKNGGVGGMLQTGVRNRSTQKNSAPLLGALVPVLPRGGPGFSPGPFVCLYNYALQL
jgi:hypothetical protein